MRVAYADPPYLGCGALYKDQHPKALDWDDPKTHLELIERLCREFPEGWALSLSSPSLATILPMCPKDVRVGAWCKTFASFKPNVNPAYAWEPLIWRGGRKRDRWEDKVRDFCIVPVTLRAGFVGAKPEGFCAWIFDLLGLKRDDDFVDIFPGSGAVTRSWLTRCAQGDVFDQSRQSQDSGGAQQ